MQLKVEHYFEWIDFYRTSKHPHENTETHNDKTDFGILDEEIEDDYWEDPEDDPDVADISWF